MNEKVTRRRPLVLPAVTLCLVGAAILAPARPQGGMQRPPDLAAQQIPTPTFRTGTTLVEVDAIVKDRKGQFASDLTRDEFEVFEDGKPQKIETLYLVVGQQARTVAASPGETAGALATPPPPPPRVFILVFDLNHMRAGRVIRAKTAAEEFLKTDVQDGDIGGVVSDGKMANNRLTSNREELIAAVRAVRPTAEAESFQSEMQEWPRINEFEAKKIDDERGSFYKPVSSAVIAAACAERPGDCDQFLGDRVDMKVVQILAMARAATRNTLDTLSVLSRSLSRLPGRKMVVFFSDGFFVEDAQAVRESIGAAARARVMLYTLDTRGLDRGTASSDILTQAAPTPGGVSLNRQLAVDALQDGANSLAVDTGGLTIRNENDFPRALREFADDGRSYYVLGYRPANPFDGKFRTIEVRVKRPGLSVRARKGYLATASPSADAATTSLPANDRASATAPRAPAEAAAMAPTLQPKAFETPPLTLSASRVVSDVDSSPVDPSAIRLRPTTSADNTLARLRDAGASARAGEPPASALPDALATAIKVGWDAYQRGDTKAARAALSPWAVHPATPPWVHYVLGWSQFAEGEFAPAAAMWERVRQAVPEFKPAYFELADAYLQQRKAAEALVVVREAARRWPADVEIQNAIGVVQVSMGALDAAIETFFAALSIAPEEATTHFNLARSREIRFVKALRGGAGPDARDRDSAIASYRRVAESANPLREQALEGLHRLEAVEAARLVVSRPVVVARVTEDSLGGFPMRLAWALDGSSVCIDAAKWTRRSGLQAPEIASEALSLVTIADGKLTRLTQPPPWAGAYWAWKSALEAPWIPTLAIVTEVRRQYDMYARGGPVNQMIRMYRLHGETVGEQRSYTFLPGTTYGWSPFAMGALAFVDRRGMVVILDAQGRKRDVPDSRVAILPAWSPDGRRIAFLQQDRGLALAIVDVK